MDPRETHIYLGFTSYFILLQAIWSLWKSVANNKLFVYSFYRFICEKKT